MLTISDCMPEPTCSRKECDEPRTTTGYCREHRNAYMREYHRQPHVVEKRRAAHYMKQYGITVEEYNHRVSEQEGLCKTCGQPPRGRGRHEVLHVDHDHVTGEVRGLLCSQCNMALGLLGDSVDTLNAMILYVTDNE